MGGGMNLSAMRLDQPPDQPPSVAAQTGAGSPIAASVLGAENPENKTPGDLNDVSKAHPQGALVVKMRLVENVINEMAKGTKRFAPFAAKAMEILKAGMAEEIAQGGQASPEGAPQPAAGAPPSAAGREGVPGMGFPG